MKSKLKKQKGITLVALVITIIVLLILAMVSIKIAMDGGLTKKASEATSQHTIAAQKEAIQTGYAAYQVELAKNSKTATLTIEGNPAIETTTDGWKITFDTNSYKLYQNGNVELLNAGNGQTGTDTDVPTEDLAYLRKELLGEDGTGKQIDEIGVYNGSGGAYIDSIEFYNEQIKSLTKTETNKLLIEYNNSIFKLEISIKQWQTTNLNYVSSKYIQSGREGQKIEYSYDGTEENKKEWTILYDYGDSVEIISPDAIGSLNIGIDDAEAKGNNDFEKAVYSYNNAIDRINNYTASLVTNPNKISVRSVGSDPSNPNNRNTAKYTSEKLASWNCQYGGTYNYTIGKYEGGIPVTINGVMEVGENNCDRDLVRISTLGISSTDTTYWFASRFVNDRTDEIMFGVNNLNLSHAFYGIAFYSRGGIYAGSCTYAVRPIVKISMNS